LGLGDVDEELESAAGQLAADAHPVPGAQPLPIGLHERERNR
jgi:hypothetical protein